MKTTYLFIKLCFNSKAIGYYLDILLKIVYINYNELGKHIDWNIKRKIHIKAANCGM